MFFLSAQVNIRHTRMQTPFCSSSHCSNTKQRGEQEEKEDVTLAKQNGNSAEPRNKYIKTGVQLNRSRAWDSNNWFIKSLLLCVSKNTRKKTHTNQDILDRKTWLDQVWLCYSLTQSSEKATSWLGNQQYKTHYRYIQIQIMKVNIPENIALLLLWYSYLACIKYTHINFKWVN